MAQSAVAGRAPAGSKRDILARIPFFLAAPLELRKAISDAGTMLKQLG